MRFTAVFAFIAAATVVSAATNAERLARGLGPNAPAKRATPVEHARRASPSGTPGGVSQCNTGEMHCCQVVQTAGSGGTVDELLSEVGLLVVSGTSVGANCDPMTIGGSSVITCIQQPVCCENNQFNGLINIGCSPINIFIL